VVDCVERKRRAELPASASAPRAVAAALSFQACLCVCTCICCICVRVFLCICMRMHICVGIYICAFFFSECCVHFGTGVLGTSACAAVCVIQMFLWHQRTHLQHILCRLCTYVCIHIYASVYMYAHVYRCICASMILFEASRRCYWDFRSVYRCACTCMCTCVCMYACICACAYVCICVYVCLCIYMHIHVYAHACGCTYALVQVHFVYLYCPIPLLHACVSQMFFQHQYAWVVGDWKWFFFPVCSWLALVAGVGGYVLTWVEIGGLPCMIFYFCGCYGGGWVRDCIRAYTHTNYLGTWCEPRCRTDTWKAGRIQID